MAKNKQNKHRLSFGDRVNLLQILPTQADYFTLIIIEDIRKKISVTQEEIKKYQLDIKGATITWNDKGARACFDYLFTDLEVGEIKLALKIKNDKKELTSELMILCKTFGFVPEKK